MIKNTRKVIFLQRQTASHRWTEFDQWDRLTTQRISYSVLSGYPKQLWNLGGFPGTQSWYSHMVQHCQCCLCTRKPFGCF